jgi:hypothetical protein
MSDETRNATYQRLRAPARLGSYTIGQLVALAASAVISLALAATLVRIGAPVGLSLTCGVLLAGAAPMTALALEGREFSVLGFIWASIAWVRSPRRYVAGSARTPSRYFIDDAADPRSTT